MRVSLECPKQQSKTPAYSITRQNHLHFPQVTKLCDMGSHDSVTSVNWDSKGGRIAVGTNQGSVKLYDAARCSLIREFSGHSGRVGTLAWNGEMLSSGSRDRSICHRDTRSPSSIIATLTGHKQEVCGLKWNEELNLLASGGNDNKLFVWEKFLEQPLHKLSDHSAAVKALAWNPNQVLTPPLSSKFK